MMCFHYLHSAISSPDSTFYFKRNTVRLSIYSPYPNSGSRCGYAVNPYAIVTGRFPKDSFPILAGGFSSYSLTIAF